MTNITDQHKEWLELVRNDDSVGLFSCFVNGEPTAAIVFVEKKEDGTYDVAPAFVAVTEGMKITDHDGVEPTEEA